MRNPNNPFVLSQRPTLNDRTERSD